MCCLLCILLGLLALSMGKPTVQLEELDSEATDGSGESPVINVELSVDEDKVDGSGQSPVQENFIFDNNNNITQKKTELYCFPQPCCSLKLVNIPVAAWRLPTEMNPRTTLARPIGSDTYPASTSLLVNLAFCFPLAVRHESGCTEIAFGNLHMLRCLQGAFTHALFPKTGIQSLSCGTCN